MDKEYVLWGLKALGNNLCKSSHLNAGGDEFAAVSLVVMVAKMQAWVA